MSKNGENDHLTRIYDFTIKIKRFDPTTDEAPYWKEYKVSIPKATTLLDTLFKIIEEQDSTLAMRYNCRSAVCGSDAMLINGKYALACQTKPAELGTSTITVEPLPYLPVIKDLVVNMDPFFEKLRAIKPYLITDEDNWPEKEFLQSPAIQKRIDDFSGCIACGSCYSSCVTVWTDKNYLGPAALAQAFRFVIDNRDTATKERLEIADSEDGVYRCHTSFNCVEACPKGIQPTDAIQGLKRKIAVQKIKSLLRLG